MARLGGDANTRTAVLSLKIGGENLNLKIETTGGKTRPVKMLPVFRSACGTIVDWTVDRIEREGRSISCKAGCGACCRQLVPISKTEAIRLAEVVAGMSDERRSEIEGRFAAVVDHFRSQGLIDELVAEPKPTGTLYKEIGLRYFEEGIPCPFLENESCSIHPERPLVCREYLVVSDPENCSRKNGLPIEVLKLPLEASKALTAIDSKSADFVDWIPLVWALEWVRENPDNSRPRPGPEIAEKFMNKLAGADLPT